MGTTANERSHTRLRGGRSSTGSGASRYWSYPSAIGIAAIGSGPLPLGLACLASFLLVPSGAALVAGLLLARFRLERIRMECERDIAIARINADADVLIAARAGLPERPKRPRIV